MLAPDSANDFRRLRVRSVRAGRRAWLVSKADQLDRSAD
jgi:hypothetical protein